MNNNQFRNLNNNPMAQGMIQNRTNSAYKFLIYLVLGVLPLLLCSLFIVDSTMANEFKQWGQNGVTNARVDVSYGIMWLIGLAVYIAIFPTMIFLTKISDEIKMDVVPGTSAAALIMLNMFVIPHSSAWFLLLSIPAFFIIGYIIGIVVIVFITFRNFNKQMVAAQNNPQFQQMVNEIQKMQNRGQGPNMGPNLNPNQKPNSKKKTEDNPFVDVKDESEDEEEK